MFRLLRRLLLWGLLIFAAIWVVSRLLNREEDFDDYDDIEMGLEFSETPVEIDVQAETVPATPPSTAETASKADSETRTGNAGASAGSASLVDVNGIGPTYAARLQDVGITTLTDLAKADPESLAEKIDVIGGRTEIEDWIKQAQEMTSSGAPDGG
jgi:predicted flap endonuclease-1-like 5' DNA nuclease